MIKRTIEISREACHITVHLDQLILQRNGQTVGSIPCEDIGVVIVDHANTTYSHAALARLVDFDAAVIICGRNHLPSGVLLPLADHSQVVWRIHDQIGIARPLQKQLWKQLVQAKIIGQAANLAPGTPTHSRLLALAKSVRSGDPENVEAQAARAYWSVWLEGETFHRDPDGRWPNALLNYGYAVIRAAIARALLTAGLLPALGLKHSHRGNPFCLADDLIEPLRPVVDRRAREIHCLGQRSLDAKAKAGLLELLAMDVRFGCHRGPLLVNLHRMVSSLVRCYEGSAKELELPEQCT